MRAVWCLPALCSLCFPSSCCEILHSASHRGAEPGRAGMFRRQDRPNPPSVRLCLCNLRLAPCTPFSPPPIKVYLSHSVYFVLHSTEPRSLVCLSVCSVIRLSCLPASPAYLRLRPFLFCVFLSAYLRLRPFLFCVFLSAYLRLPPFLFCVFLSAYLRPRPFLFCVFPVCLPVRVI